ncbi:hypothetical protein [Candidatus Symbiobacter mobilis]|uniref:Peptidase C39-like domain-containing protein n=1 Tax=Candidatus Symbiobacter mobilis CR TaxID=946483 RepID=U5NDM9_9BURK|nr:hypothetical protein [Candidatus Symbiobacter mobilis]AGX88323.1 hypothetical protein Cenrod_2259 [Candidatus Symbiobacter mobilis CR]
MNTHDLYTNLWPDKNEQFFPNLLIQHRQQIGTSCVSTGLSLLTKEEPSNVRNQINTQDPISWSRYLQTHGMKLAYCSTDFRRLQHYVKELLRIDDLFTISTYSSLSPGEIGAEPDENGWICGSHFVVLYKSTVYDTRWDTPLQLQEYPDNQRYIKRIFRIVPANHERGL